MQLKVGLHLHASGTRRHFIELFHNMRVCCSYDVILNNIREISRIASKQIVAIGKHANTITAYDNFEYTMGVQQQHVDDKSTFHSCNYRTGVQRPVYSAERIESKDAQPEL